MTASPRLIIHVIYRLDVGGLENGLVNLINQLPEARFRHVILCLKGFNPEFAQRIRRADVTILDLDKKEGKDLRIYWKMWKIFRTMQPDIVHTRNLTSLLAQVPAWLCHVPRRIHGEHGWDMSDLAGNNRKHRWLRRLLLPLTHHIVALSPELARYLTHRVGIRQQKISQLCNGVDTTRFHPMTDHAPWPLPFPPAHCFIVGTVGRMQAVKNQTALVHAFIHLCRTLPSHDAARVRLVLIGDGPLRSVCQAMLEQAGLAEQAWLPGTRHDIPDILRCLSLFVLPSLAEGISNTLLEALASGVPVVATEVGGNPDLLTPGINGTLYRATQPEALATILQHYLENPDKLQHERENARQTALARFSLDQMIQHYQTLYEQS